MKKTAYVLVAASMALHASAAVNFNIPDKEGMTLKGVVYCGNEPVAGAQVSDGINVTLTDENGAYYLASKKECGHVFVCNPKGYKYVIDKKYPQFYHTISSDNPDIIEQADFELVKDTAKDHTIVFLADMQLSGHLEDQQQFGKYSVPDINKSITDARSKGNDVYIITLGDQSFDYYWSLCGIGIPQVKQIMDSLDPDAFFNCMGNHDNIPNMTGDWAVSRIYREEWGPTYYSFNIGDVHYVVLDNIQCSETNPEYSYECTITTQITKWMRKDLANVSKDTPLVICMHAPLFSRPQCTSPNVVGAIKFRYGYGQTFMNSISGFKDVRVFTGHAHTNYTVLKNQVIEYNVGSVCGNLWYTGHYNEKNNVCTDGSPAGYRIMNYENGKIDTYYKCAVYDRNYQFRSYDLNNTHITAEKYCPSYPDQSVIETWISNGGYGYGNSDYNADGTAKDPNRILINVFAYDTRWKVEAFEDGKALKVNRISGYDPFFMISDVCMRYEHDKFKNSGDPTKNSHLFLTKASSPTSTVTIKVTDEYGNVYTENMVRPKEFSFNAYVNDGAISGMADLISEDAAREPEYYTLTGMRIPRPEKGICIMRKGTKVSKVIITK